MLRLALSRDILAIRCLEKHVCIGIGNSVHVYCIATRQLVANICALDDDNIHDIVRGPGTRLIVYGGKSLIVYDLKFTGDRGEFQSCCVLQRFTDWIIAAESFSIPDTDRLCILFAHNNLGLFDLANKQIRSVWCQEKCILYGGSLLATNNHETMVFAGTVFQEILIWRVKNDHEDSQDSPVLHRLMGHKGVIFSVIYEPNLRIISSTSDDRTIRLWRIRNKFVSQSDDVDWCYSEIDLTTTMYGHTARVWRSVIKNNRILSIGEDSLICTWSLDGKLQNKLEAHHGAEIWSVDVSDDNELIFTGGADGAVNVWHFQPTESPRNKIVHVNDGSSIIPKYVCRMNSRTILILMDGGIVVGYDNDFVEIRRFFIPTRYEKYCVTEISPDRRKIFFGSRDGYGTIYEESADSNVWTLEKIMDNKILESTINSCHWLTNDTIIVCGNAGALKLVDTEKNPIIKRQRSEFILPPSRERWTTAAIIVKNLLLCGDRAGTIYVFDLIHGTAEPTQIFSKIHGRLGVQFLSVSGDNVSSTGRDGTLRYYENRENDGKQYLRALHSHKMPMDWVCRILKHQGDVFVLGFKEIEFVIYSMKLKRLVVRFVCGGGHRSWDCTISCDGSMKFLYIKDKSVYEIDHHIRNTIPSILNGFHTKEIYRCECISSTSSGRNIVVSAGEDSTIRVNSIARKNPQSKTFVVTPLNTYDGHISNIKSMAVINMENTNELTKNLIFSGGGRAQLKIWEICVRLDDENLTSDNVTCRQLFSFMLHGSDKYRKKTLASVKTGIFADPETRFMDMNVRIWSKNNNFLIIFVACSDGFLRIFSYDIFNNNLRLGRVVNQDCNRCTLKIHTFLYKNDVILMSMRTDGIVNFWRITDSDIEIIVQNASEDDESKITNAKISFARMKIHQNGINSFDFRDIDESQYFLLTGGDDNSLSLIFFEILETKDGLSIRKLSKWESSSIHSAQITGAKFVDDSRIISTGIDQKVVLHSYGIIDNVLDVSQKNEIITFVPDVQGVTLCCKTQGDGATMACVYGKGFEVFALEQEDA